MPADHRTESRSRWAASAAGWRRRADQLRDATMPVTTRMLEGAAPQPGDTVLELAAGLGDVGFAAAGKIAPGGTLITSDFVPEMLSAAQERAEQLGVDNVRFRQIDAETIDQPAASLDVVLCRWGFMLMRDPEAALRQTRRVLRPGGRLALAAWEGPEANPWSSVPQRELRSRGLAEAPEPGAPGQFAWADRELISEALYAAGFVDFSIESVPFAMAYDDADHWWESQLDLSRGFAEGVRAAAPADRDSLRAALQEAAAGFTAPGGRLEIPARTWVVAAVAVG